MAQKPDTTQKVIYVDNPLLGPLLRLAKEQKRTFSNYMNVLIENHLKEKGVVK